MDTVDASICHVAMDVRQELGSMASESIPASSTPAPEPLPPEPRPDPKPPRPSELRPREYPPRALGDSVELGGCALPRWGPPCLPLSIGSCPGCLLGPLRGSPAS